MADEKTRDDEGGAPAAGDFAPLPESADSAAPPSSAEPQPKGGDELDRLLAEFDQGTKAAQTDVPEQRSDTLDELDRILAEPAQNQPDQASVDSQVEARARGLFEQERYRGQLADEFGKYCSRGQARIPDNLPDDYYRSELLAMSTTDPRLEVAFEASLYSPAAIRAELARVMVGLDHARMNPNATPEVIQALEQQVRQWQVADQARTILRQAESAIIRKATARANIDPDVTADRAMVTAAMKGSGAKMNGAEPPPNLGHMTDQEFRSYKAQFGF
jgi:hypothetical protein